MKIRVSSYQFAFIPSKQTPIEVSCMEKYSCRSRQYNEDVNLETSLCALKENKLSLSFTDISIARFPIRC